MWPGASGRGRWSRSSPRCCTSARRAMPCFWSRRWRICSSAAWCGTARTAGSWRRPWTPTTVGVPETLRHLIEQQFERLAPAAQAVVAAASVAGVEFAAAAVAAGVGAPAEDVDAQCATLARHGQFLRANGTGHLAGRHGDRPLWLRACPVSGSGV